MKVHMKLPRRRFLHLAAGVAALPALSRVASAENYPTRPIHMIVPVPAGGTFDIVARLVAQSLSERIGQQIVIENRGGAGTNIGTAVVAHATPTATHCCSQAPRARSTPRSIPISISVSRAILCRSPASSVRRSLWRSIQRFRPRRLRNSSLTPRAIPARSIWARAASLHRPCSRRAVQPDGGPQDRPRAVSRRGAVGHRPARRPDPGDVQHARLGYEFRQGGHVATARGDQRQTHGRAARCSGARRDLARL